MRKEINPRLRQAEPMRRCKLGECHGACCLYGVWLGEEEAETIRANADQIAQHMPPALQNPELWFTDEHDEDDNFASGRVIHSRVLPDPSHHGGSACAFLRDDHKCALQIASVAAGQHPWQWKPFYCILHPLDLDDQGRITLDQTEAMLAEPGSCLRPAAEKIPLLETFEEELRYLLGDEEYEDVL